MQIGEGGDVQELPRCDGGDDCDNGDGSDDDGNCVDGDGDGDGDDDGWITPENVQQAKKDMGGLVEACLEGVVVGCMTDDFAMQVCVPLNSNSVCDVSTSMLRTYLLITPQILYLFVCTHV